MLNPVLFSIGGLVWAIALLKRELLVRIVSFRLIFGISVVLFLIALTLYFTNAVGDAYYGALLSPLVSLTLFRAFRRLFIWRYQREPRDTFFRWEEGLDADRIFNIVFFVLTGLLWMLSAAVVQ